MTSGVFQRIWPTTKKKMNKTNREKNTEHDRKELLRVRPKEPDWQFKELEEVVNRWVRDSINTKHE